jgi:hypothetical protein
MFSQRPLVSHEIPKALFPNHNFINQYPYVLAHLCSSKFETYDEEYVSFYKECLKHHSYSILDNSAFELGESIDQGILIEVANELSPTHLIIPDILHNTEITQQKAIEFLTKYKDKLNSTKLIGVIQGQSFKEAFNIFEYYMSVPEIDVIAVPFDLFALNQCESEEHYKYQRPLLVKALIEQYGRWKTAPMKKLHLLGCATPNEFLRYSSEELQYVKSIDTSAPIVYGWNELVFVPGIDIPKPKDKLAENLNIELSPRQRDIIAYNVHKFRNYLK